MGLIITISLFVCMLLSIYESNSLHASRHKDAWVTMYTITRIFKYSFILSLLINIGLLIK